MTKSATAISLADFHARVSSGVKPRSKVEAQFKFAADVIGADVETRTVPFVFSDNSVDSYGDTIDAKGWQWDRSGAGTIALFGHDPGSVDNIIGRAHNVRVEGNRLLGDIVFATAEENPNAERVFRLVKAGILNSVSVGFQPLEWAQAKDRARPGGIDFRKQKLLEISVVGIPANENAIAQARAFGLDVEGLQFDAFPAPVVSVTREGPKVTKRGLGSVSALASILNDLGWLTGSVEWEAEIEGDGSDIPTRLTEAMNTLGQILVDMTVEEVAELLADDEEDGSISVDFMFMAAPTDGQKAFIARAKAAKMSRETVQRAGKVFSAANEQMIRAAITSMTDACAGLGSMLDAIEPADVTEKAATQAEMVAAAERETRLRDLDLLEFSSH
jgi:HK97 family phage prohead protease